MNRDLHKEKRLNYTSDAILAEILEEEHTANLLHAEAEMYPCPDSLKTKWALCFASVMVVCTVLYDLIF